jgi:hypothetical protein
MKLWKIVISAKITVVDAVVTFIGYHASGGKRTSPYPLRWWPPRVHLAISGTLSLPSSTHKTRHKVWEGEAEKEAKLFFM